MDFLEDAVSKQVNHTFVMSHYPSGTLIKGATSNGANFDLVTRGISVWVSGHLHRLVAGLGNTMYANVRDKYLELELGDMKSHAMFRVLAIDNDYISFVDLPIYSSKLPLKLGDVKAQDQKARSPIVLITHPKDGRFLITHHELRNDLSKVRWIRFLLWSHDKPMEFKLYVDGIELNFKPKFIGRGEPWSSSVIPNKTDEEYIPLWASQWDPSPYNDTQTHALQVSVRDSAGRIGSHTIKFKFNGDLIEEMGAGSGGFIISIDFEKLVRIIFL